jgi:hypothetical protein
MPKKAQDGGGNFLGTGGLAALADVNAVVLAQRVAHMEDFKSDKPEHKQYAPSTQIKAHILIVSSKGGARDGEFWPDQNLISAGWTLKLDDGVAEDGEVIAGRAATYGANRPCLNAPSDPEWAAIGDFYRARDLDPGNSAHDTKLFEILLTEHKEANRASVREANAKLSGKGDGGGDAAGADDEPPW